MLATYTLVVLLSLILNEPRASYRRGYSCEEELEVVHLTKPNPNINLSPYRLKPSNYTPWTGNQTPPCLILRWPLPANQVVALPTNRSLSSKAPFQVKSARQKSIPPGLAPGPKKPPTLGPMWSSHLGSLEPSTLGHQKPSKPGLAKPLALNLFLTPNPSSQFNSTINTLGAKSGELSSTLLSQRVKPNWGFTSIPTRTNYLNYLTFAKRRAPKPQSRYSVIPNSKRVSLPPTCWSTITQPVLVSLAYNAWTTPNKILLKTTILIPLPPAHPNPSKPSPDAQHLYFLKLLGHLLSPKGKRTRSTNKLSIKTRNRVLYKASLGQAIIYRTRIGHAIKSLADRTNESAHRKIDLALQLVYNFVLTLNHSKLVKFLIIASFFQPAKGLEFSIASLNLGNPNKVDPAIDALRQHNIIFLQEDHLTQQQFEGVAQNLSFNYLVAGSHRTREEIETKYVNRSRKKHQKVTKSKTKNLINPNQARTNRGLTTLFNHNLKANIRSETGKKFRTLIHHWTVSPSQVILLINTYGPNSLTQNNDFFIELADYISTIRNTYQEEGTIVSIILAGDMNAHLAGLDTQLPSDKQFDGFQYLIETLELQDTFRSLHPNRVKFTWKRTQFNKAQHETQETRIDYIFTSKDVTIQEADIMELNRITSSDHCAVWAKLTIDEADPLSIPQLPTAEVRPRLRTSHLSQPEIKRKLANLDINTLAKEAEILDNVSQSSSPQKSQEQINNAYEGIIATLKAACSTIFGVAKERFTSKVLDPLTNHRGLHRCQEVIDKIDRTKDLCLTNLVDQARLNKVCRKIHVTSKGRISFTLDATKPAETLKILAKARKKALLNLNNKLRNIKNKGIQRNIDNLQHKIRCKPDLIFKSFQERQASTTTPPVQQSSHGPGMQ